ncbi:MAG: protein translocase SEC61 complex subunit gamma [Candidatus Aenigmatarchaeota archaeon]
MGILSKLSPQAMKERFQQYRRTIEIARKPDREEWMNTAKVTGAGIALIGAIGFVIFLAYHFIINAVVGVA